MRTKNILIGFTAIALLTLLVLPATSLANTYQFIDSSKNLQSVEANNPTTALETAYQLGIHSGVMLVKEGAVTLSTSANTTGSSDYYRFIDTSDDMQGLWAINPSTALETAYQLGVHSGVILSN